MSGVAGTYAPPQDGARRLAALRVVDPRAWRAEVRAALRACKGRVGGDDGAAARLGLSRGTLFKWLREDVELSHVETASVGRPSDAPQKRTQRKAIDGRR